MPNPADLILSATGTGPVFTAVGDVYRVLASGEQTGGAYALIEVRVLPGGGPPPHLHRREEESFYILAGEITFFLTDHKIATKPGAFVQMPRNTPHAFKNEGTTEARMLILVAPAGFEDFIKEFGSPAVSLDVTPPPVTEADIARLLEMAPKYGVEILPPPVER